MLKRGWFTKLVSPLHIFLDKEEKDWALISRSNRLRDCHAVIIILQNSHQTALQMMVFKQSSSFNLMF